MKILLIRTTLLGIVSILQATAQTGVLATAAGNGSSIYSGDNVLATQASVGAPASMALDRAGNLYIADTQNSRILKVNALTGILTSIAGGGSGGNGGPATNAALISPCGIKLDAADNIFISESCVAAGGVGGGSSSLSRIRRIDAVTGIISAVAGNGVSGFSGDNGPALDATLNIPAGLGMDSSGNLCVADSGNHRIRQISSATSTITSVAGTGVAQFLADGIPAVFSPLNNPNGCTFDTRGNLYIADAGNSRIRKVDALSGIITTIAGTSSSGFNGDGIPGAAAQISFPLDVVVDAAGNIYFVDGGNARIRRVDAVTGLISTIAGGGFQSAGDGVLATNAFLDRPVGLVLGPNNRLYFSDRRASKIWVITLPAAPNSSVTLLADKTVVGFSEPVTLTATVVPASAGGTVSFFAGNNILGPAVSLVNGVASLTLSIPVAGSFAFQARYSGDGVNSPSSSNIVNVALKVNTSVFLSSSVTTATTGQPVTFNASVTPSNSNATGTIQFLSGSTVLGAVQLSGGFASFTVPQLPPGANSITASYGGDSSNNGSTSSPVIVTVKTPSSVSLISNANPATAGQSIIFTATVSSGLATGTVQFFNGATSLGSAPLSSGAATLATSQLTAGTYSITATYDGNDQVLASSSPALSQTVKANSSVVLVSSANPASQGQIVTFTATVTPASATGTVEFRNGAVLLGTAPVSGGIATIATNQLAAGSNSITASYGGDNLNTASTSNPVVQTIKTSSTTLVVSSANPANQGQSVSFTATVSPSSATGSIQFLSGATIIGTAAVVNGVATFATTQLTAGTSLITASYSGDTLTAASSSSPLSQTIKFASQIMLASNANPAGVGQTVTFTARVSPLTASGSIQFLNGASVLGTAAISNGSASFSTSQLARGTYSITANYAGDSLSSAATSAILSQEIKAASSVILNAGPSTTSTGLNVTFTARVNPSTATGTVQFLNGATVIGTATINNGVASFSTKELAAGMYSVVAKYGGDSALLPATSGPVSLTIKARAVVTLASSANPAAVGQSITFTATVSPASATGSVRFLNGTIELASANVVNGVATYTTSGLPAGITLIAATYSGDALTTTDKSNTVGQVIKTVSSFSIATNGNPAVAGEAVTFTANVYPATATGSFQFFNGSTSLGWAPIINGVVRFTTSRLVAGTFTINVFYGGDSMNTPSSASFSQVVVAAMPACRVTYNVVSQSGTSFATSISIANTGTATFEPWALTFTWLGDQRVTQAVNSTFVQNGKSVRLNGLASNRAIAPGATLNGIGFNANYTGANTPPPAFFVSGVRCQ